MHALALWVPELERLRPSLTRPGRRGQYRRRPWGLHRSGESGRYSAVAATRTVTSAGGPHGAQRAENRTVT